LHASDRRVPFTETLEAVNELHKKGKFVELGLSNFTAYEVAEVVMTCKANGWVRPTVYQAMYNAITRAIEPELVAACRRYGISIVVYNPVAGGLFSGKYKLDEVPAEGRFSQASGQGGNYRKRYFKDGYFEALSIIEPVAKKNNLTLIEVALRWVTHHSALKITPESKGNDGIIIGVSSLPQLEQNLKALEEGPLPQEVVDVLDKAWLICKAEVPNYWQGELEYTYDTQEYLFGNKK
jgi:aflatoxin B1 aldehyde reductase